MMFCAQRCTKENEVAKNKTPSSELNTLNVQKDVNKELFNNIYQYIAGRVAGVDQRHALKGVDDAIYGSRGTSGAIKITTR